MKILLKMIYPLHFIVIPTKLAQLYLKDNLKNLLYFGDLDPSFKVTSQLTKVEFIAKMGYFFNKWMDIHQTSVDIIVVTDLRDVKFR